MSGTIGTLARVATGGWNAFGGMELVHHAQGDWIDSRVRAAYIGLVHRTQGELFRTVLTTLNMRKGFG